MKVHGLATESNSRLHGNIELQNNFITIENIWHQPTLEMIFCSVKFEFEMSSENAQG